MKHSSKASLIIAVAAVFVVGVTIEAPAPASAQSDLSFKASGDVDARSAYAPYGPTSVFKQVASSQEMSAGAIVDGKIVFSREYTTLGLLDYTFEQQGLIDPGSGATLGSLSFTVNELYADLNYGDLLYLRLGKQRLKWGAGFVYNPSDPVNPPKDPLALRAVREGVPAARLEVIEKPVSLAAFAVLFDSLDQTGYGAKLSTSALEGSDISLSGYYSQSESWTASLNASMSPLYQLPGWDTIQVWFEGGLYGKGRYASFEAGPIPGSVATGAAPGTSYSFLVGASGQLPVARTMLLGEYYHLSEGLDRAQSSAVYAALSSPNTAVVAASSPWFAELALRPARTSSDYLYLSVTQPTITDSQHPVFDKIGLLATCLVNLADSSFFATGGVVTTFVKDSEVDLTVTWANGAGDTEFGNVLAPFSATVDVKVFF